MRKHINILFAAALVSIMVFAVSCGTPAAMNSAAALRFGDDGKFRIVQFSDIHLDASSPTADETADVITAVIEKEQPQLIILTGDIVTYQPAAEGWEYIAELFGGFGIPWCVTMGNHDGEFPVPGISKKDIFAYLEGKPSYIGSVGEDMHGMGNFAIELLGSSSGKPEAIVYCMDSNDYPDDQNFGKYDWFRFDQISWYRRTGDRYRAQNGGDPLPSLMFFHIPLQESAWLPGMKTTVGTQNERAGMGINSGMFANLLLQGDVIGTFSGHDHDNDFAGIYKGILMSYCRVSGTNAYGDLERGGRVIQLYEGRAAFDTWISTPGSTEHLYYYPSGISEADEVSMEYLPATDISLSQNGVDYKYFEGGRLKHTDHLYTKAREVKRGRVANFSLAPAEVTDSMGFEYNTFIKIPERGVYRFYTFSDDGSRLYIGDRLVVDNDGSHSARRMEGMVALEEGYHKVRLLYFEDYMGEQLEVGIASRGIPETLIPDEMLFVE